MTTGHLPESPAGELATLFHKLNNQLGIILANAELLELKGVDETTRTRAGLVVSSAIEAMATARHLRSRVEDTQRVDGGSST